MLDKNAVGDLTDLPDLRKELADFPLRYSSGGKLPEIVDNVICGHVAQKRASLPRLRRQQEEKAEGPRECQP